MAARRTRIERGLYQDGDVYYACATPPGSRTAVWRSLGKVGRMEARRLRDEFVAEVRRSDGRLNRAWRRTPFADAADAWHAMQISLVEVDELAQTTLEGYEISVRRHLKPWFGARAVHSVTPDDLVTWHASQRQQGAAPWSIKGRWNALRGVLGYAVRQGWIASNPADALTSRERPKGGGSRKRFLRDEEMRALLAQASGRYRLLIAVLLFGGVRISEALGLTWEDVEFRSGHFRVRYQLARNGKRKRLKTVGSSRDVVLMESLARELRQCRLASRHSRGRDPVFATASGTSMSARNAGRALSRLSASAGLDGVTPHALRHTYASILIAQGRDPVFVADQLGHSNPTTTLRIYAHLFRAAQQEQTARDQLDGTYGELLG